jgi:uncharacterized membrane protein YphA (DoxX/SURF4 family)
MMMGETNNQDRRLLPVLALGVFAMGAYLRVHNFWITELWLDEYSFWWVSARGGWGDAVRRAWEYQAQSPLTYLSAKVSVTAFGAGPFSLRLPSIILGIA